MAELSVDLDRLATHLRNKMKSEGLSLRSAAKEMGLGAATLSRLLQGTENENIPDLKNINKATKWVGRTLADFSPQSRRRTSTIADVEVHLRALPGLDTPDVDALVGMVKAGYERAKELRSKKGS